MNDVRLQELINIELFGNLSPKEHKELYDYYLEKRDEIMNECVIGIKLRYKSVLEKHWKAYILNC